jgi:hypothetical protein
MREDEVETLGLRRVDKALRQSSSKAALLRALDEVIAGIGGGRRREGAGLEGRASQSAARQAARAFVMTYASTPGFLTCQSARQTSTLRRASSSFRAFGR